MDAFEPRLRRRGLLLNQGEFEEGELGEAEGPEGIRIRLRIIAPRLRRSVVAAGRSSSPVKRFSHPARVGAPRLLLTAHAVPRSGSRVR